MAKVNSDALRKPFLSITKKSSTMLSIFLSIFVELSWLESQEKFLTDDYKRFRASSTPKYTNPPLKMAEVKLHGTWPSPFSYRVIWALELKGIPYEYAEEDLINKSPLLLQYNPVHKKIPVLVHGGKPICESMVILEYIEETWPQKPLLPVDPLERAVARFWIKFVEEKGIAVWMLFLSTDSEEKETARKQSLEMLKTIEEQGFGNSGRKFFMGDEIGMVDLAFGWIAQWLGVIEEVVGVKLLEAEAFPRWHAWANSFREAAVIRENLPDRNLMAAAFKRRREQLLQFASK